MIEEEKEKNKIPYKTTIRVRPLTQREKDYHEGDRLDRGKCLDIRDKTIRIHDLSDFGVYHDYNLESVLWEADDDDNQ